MSLYVDIRKKLGDFTLETKFEIQDGVTGILGASGCGKSMTLRCIAGIMKPDEGHIELNGKVLFDSSRKINVRPQDRHGYPAAKILQEQKLQKQLPQNNRATFMYRIGARHFPIRECLPEKSSILESAVIIFILSLSRKRLLIRTIHFHVIWKRSLMMYFQRCSWYVLSMQKAQKRAENSILIKSVWR